ncbi:MAG: delta-aminolevulinic acid dehydratase, partial [Candidatus Heimdallarchaeota archaeon]
DNLKTYIENNDYRGYDPYDGLQAPIFKLPFLRSNKLIRFATQQLVKRLPFSIRPILLIPKGFNPVTLGLAIQSYAYLYRAEPNNQKEHLSKISYLVDELKKMIPEGFSGACWGYDFDWEARYSKIPAYQPSVVATGIIVNAIFIAYQLTRDKEQQDLVLSASDFVIRDLHRIYSGDNFCFSYSPFDKEQVYNASMKGAILLSQAYFISKSDKLRDLAKKAVDFVIQHQRDDGSWPYSLASTGGWTDNYHTGYVLDCLHEYQSLTNDLDYTKNIKLGYSFYKNNFITKDGAPKFYYNKMYPIDCTSAAQTILTTTRFGDKELAKKVAKWMTQNMQKSNGSFKFRKFRNYTISTSFMRWSDAWMFAAMSYLVYETEDN